MILLISSLIAMAAYIAIMVYGVWYFSKMAITHHMDLLELANKIEKVHLQVINSEKISRLCHESILDTHKGLDVIKTDTESTRLFIRSIEDSLTEAKDEIRKETKQKPAPEYHFPGPRL